MGQFEHNGHLFAFITAVRIFPYTKAVQDEQKVQN